MILYWAAAYEAAVLPRKGGSDPEFERLRIAVNHGVAPLHGVKIDGR